MSKKSIIFVCLGNICRSPIAEGCANAFVSKHRLDIMISSAATSAWHVGEAPCDNAIKVAHMNNVDIRSLRASQITRRNISEYDLIVALDDSNYNDLVHLGAKNVVKLGAYGYDSQDVPDPYFFNGFEGFEIVYKMIEECVNELLSKELE